MPLKNVIENKLNTEKKRGLINQSFYFNETLKDNDCNLNARNPDRMERCYKCGYPLKSPKLLHNELLLHDNAINFDKQLSKENSHKICFICRREKILNFILNSTYVIFGAIFVIFFIVIFFDKITLDICLMIGCLEIIFLLFFGRLLEAAVFFGLTKREKIIATLYRFSITAEIQIFDILMKQLRKAPKLDLEMLKSFLQTTIFQANNLPLNWFSLCSAKLSISEKDYVAKLSELFNNKEDEYLKELITHIPPSGVSNLFEIFIISDNYQGLDLLKEKLNELLLHKINYDWLNDFYINEEKYQAVLKKINSEDIFFKIKGELSNYKEPNVPSIDLIGSGKKFFQNPLIRYIMRILFYMLIAFLLGLLYRITD